MLGERAEVSPPLAGSGPASALPLLASPAPSQPSTAASDPPSANPSEGSPSPVALKPTRDTDAEVEAILALHMQGRHGDEWLAVGGLPTELLPDVRVLSALVADYGFSERALIVRVLRRFPQRALLAKLQQFVAESGPAVRWGALRPWWTPTGMAKDSS